MTADTRKKIILEESNGIRSIQANTIFTLLIELMKETQKIRNFAEVISFPFIKIKQRGSDDFILEAYDKFTEFIASRIDTSLFASEEVIKLVTEYSGGLPRQLLRIIENAARMADDTVGKITLADMEKALDKLGNDMARYIEPEEFAELKRIKDLNSAGTYIGFGYDLIQLLLENELLMEYNDGSDKRANPLINRAKLY